MPCKLAPSMALLSEVYMALTARKMMLVFWATYSPYSRGQMLLHVILPQVTLAKTPDNVNDTSCVA
jgi:hypothetical protein